MFLELVCMGSGFDISNSKGPLVVICPRQLPISYHFGMVQGEVIGISNMQAIAADGVSFAIPIDSARLIIDQVISEHACTCFAPLMC